MKYQLVSCLLLCGLLCSTISFAQNKLSAPTSPIPVTDPHCNTVSGVAWRVANDPAYASFYQNAYNVPTSAVQPSSAIPCDGTNSIVVPVAFHFDAGFGCMDTECLLLEMQDQLDALNIAFGNNVGVLDGNGNDPGAACPAAYPAVSTGTCISFCLAIPPAGGDADLDPTCDPPITVGVFNGGGFNAGGIGAPGWNDILNIFVTTGNCLGVADGIPGAGNGDGVTVCAEAFGGFGGPSSACGSGLDDNATYNTGATLIHEIGHYLGLFHTHVDGAPTCTDNDVNAPGPFVVNDTPIMANQFFGCPNPAACQFNTQVGCNTIPIPVANFMAYTDDACMTMFTEDQAAVMNFWALQLFGGVASQCSDPNPVELTTTCGSVCAMACATTVTTAINENVQFCTVSSLTAFPDPQTIGLVLDDSSDAVYTWSTGNYLSAGGTLISAPNVLMSTNCSTETETYFLNIDCGTTPLPTTLDGGTYTLTVYPGPPADITTLVTVTGENTCDEPIVTIIPGCENYVSITPDPANPTFPATAGQAGTLSYDIVFIPDPSAPECCPIPSAGELIIGGAAATQNQDGDLENGGIGWTSTSTNFGTVYCNTGLCGTGAGTVNYGVAPNSGTELAWFGGVGAFEIGTLSTDVIIPSCPGGDAVLTFAYENSSCGSAADFIELTVDGVQLWMDDADPATCGTPGSPLLITLSLAAFTDGLSHTIEFNSESGSSGTGSNFTIDNIILETTGCAAESICEAVQTASYLCDLMIDLEQDLTASDPCSCNNDQTANGAGDGTFSEMIIINGTEGLNLCAGPGSVGIIDPVTGMDVSTMMPPFVEGPLGTYTITFNHTDATGYVLEFFNCGTNQVVTIGIDGTPQTTITNVCYYPIIDLPVTSPVCDTDSAFDLLGVLTNDMPDGATAFGGGFTYTGTGVGPSGTQFDPAIAGVGLHTITAVFTPDVIVGTSVDPLGDVCTVSLDVQIEVSPGDPSFICPSGLQCGAGPLFLDPQLSGGTWSGTGGVLVNTVNNTIDIDAIALGTTLTLIYTAPGPNGCNGTAMCTFTVTNQCPADSGSW